MEKLIELNSLSIISQGSRVNVLLNGKEYKNLTIKHGYMYLSANKGRDVVFTTDSHSSLIFADTLGVCMVKSVQGNVFKERVVSDDGKVIYEIESSADYDRLSYIFEDSKLVDVESGEFFFVRHNQFRFFFPLKYDYLGEKIFVCEEKLERMIFLMSYIWLKKNMTSHDPLN